MPALITKLGIQPNQFPIFLTYDVYLTQSGGCCIGGYHSSEGSVSNPALSHEVGEWADDPLVVNTNGNNTPCGILENADPLENTANFGGFPYVLHGFTYNLQDLATLPYFGAPASTTVHGWTRFQGNPLTACQNGA